MILPTPYHQLGKFIVSFQHTEAAINEILILLANALQGLEAFRIKIIDWLYPDV